MNGTYYDGEWLDGTYHGYGVHLEPNGDRYSGQWANGQKHGKGIYELKSGDVFEGIWQDDQKHGYGILTTSTDRQQFRQLWKNGKNTEQYLINEKPVQKPKADPNQLEEDKSRFDEDTAEILMTYDKDKYRTIPYLVMRQKKEFKGTFRGDVNEAGVPDGAGIFIFDNEKDYHHPCFTLQGLWVNGAFTNNQGDYRCN